MISYGYGYEHGKLIIIEKEAEIVKRIFQEYLVGKTLKEIAMQLQEEKTEYDKGIYQWNKNRICRILENKKYIGENDYPIIISQDSFNRTNAVKSKKGFQKKITSKRVLFLKPIVFCAECGQNMHRRAKQRIKEKWLCPSGCKCSKYIDDDVLVSAMTAAIQTFKKNPNLAPNIPSEPTYQRTPQIMQYTNAITKVIHSEQPNFDLGKKVIYKCANLKFQACTENPNLSYTKTVLAILKDNQTPLQETKIKKIVSKLVVHSDGKISVYLINGIAIQEK